MIYLTGDLHGHTSINRLASGSFPEGKYLTKDDYLVILGDFGLLWSGNKAEKYALSWLDEKPWTTLFIDGNHENFDMLDNLSTIPMFGSDVGKVNDSVFHLRRGELYNIDDNSIFTLGGADSIDKAYRTEGVSWWPQELLTNEDIRKAWNTLETVNWKVDYVFTHTCPAPLLSYFSIFQSIDFTCHHLMDIAQKLDFKHWFFGHMHTNKDLVYRDKPYTCLFEQIIKLG